jgi:hypothetical protein
MIINQWVPAAHKGDAIGDARGESGGAAISATSPTYALTIDDDLKGDVRPFSDPGRGAESSRSLLRAPVANDGGVRVRTLGRVLQYTT